MATYRIAVLPGDGIGPEVMNVASRITLEAASAIGVKLDMQEYEGGARHYQRTGVVMGNDVFDQCKQADAVFLAAIGLPEVRKPDGTEVQPEMMFAFRWGLDLYAAVRPIKLYPGVPSALRAPGPIDMVILRENTEGLFASYGGGSILRDHVATDTMVITREGAQKISNFAFRLAQRRKGRPTDGKKMVTLVDKANIFRSLAFFRKVFYEVAVGYPDVASEAAYVDAMSLYMVQDPCAFDVVVTENMFGDILTDLGAGLVGGLGMAPSGEIGDRYGLFQPSHGTAPTIAGLDVANPLATVLSGAMMLDWLGDKHGDEAAVRAGQLIEAAVAHVLQQGEALPRDLGGTTGCKAVGEAVLRALEQVGR